MTRAKVEVCGFYGITDQSLWHQSCDMLRYLWIIGGNYNEIISSEEKDKSIHRSDNLIDMFRMALLECSLTDLGFVGERLT